MKTTQKALKLSRPQTNKALGIYIASVTLFMATYTLITAYQYL